MKRIFYFILLISNFTYSQVSKPQHEPPETINRYAAVVAFDICTNSITVSDATEFNAGDTVLMIQMKGAVIDTSNTPAFGTILDYGNAGNYEFNFISAKSGNQLTFLNKLTRTYDIPDGVVQLVRVPKYKFALFFGGLVPLAWDGATGGIICVYASLNIISSEIIDASNRGFRGAAGYNASSTACNQNNYYYPASSQFAALRGESIGSVSQARIKGKGSIAGGGGGGNSHNSGGGGNGGAGGQGGNQSDSCNATPFDNGGIGGKSLLYNSAINKIFMGSGGGAGHSDNSGANGSGGGNGGGIIIIITDTLETYGESIIADGNNGDSCSSANCNEGTGGGGAGGTILLSINGVVTSLNATANGGRGANMNGAIVPGGRSGPGGGGGGGVLFTTGNALPANVTYVANGGLNGVITQDAGNNWGAMPGSSGTNLFNLTLPWDTVLFTPNIDSVRIKDSANYCNNIQFTGLGFTNTYPVAAAGWQWYFGDGGTSSAQNPIHNYNAVSNYDVKLIVTDINGCKDSIIKTINTAGTMLAEAGSDTAFCVSGSKIVQLNGSGTGLYSWSPAGVLNNSTLQNPTATINTTTKFYLTVSNGNGCSKTDSVTVTLNQNPIVKTLNDTAICINTTLVLSTNGASNYSWSPGIYVSDSTIASPQYADTVGHTLYVTGTDLNGCFAKDTIYVDVQKPLTFFAPESKMICKGESVQLNGNNGNAVQYLWSPAAYLSNATIIDPIANPPVTIAYTLKVSDNACKTDSSFAVNVTVVPMPKIYASKSNDLNCIKPFAQLNVSGASNYIWTPAYGLNNDSIPNPIANPAFTTTYFVTATDSAICNGKDSVTVVANFKNHGIFLPNSFTPNGDGLNDCFGIKYYRDIQNLEFIIFNRYGNTVFRTHNADECWDGNYMGKPASPGSYVYFIKAKTLCGEVVIKDNVMLIR